jgi:hypothetical protein
VPTALFAQEKIADDQPARVARLAAAGAVLPLLLNADGTPDAAGLAAIIADLRQPEVRARLRAQSQSVVALGGARQAAWYGLQLVLDTGELQSAMARATPASLPLAGAAATRYGILCATLGIDGGHHGRG